jgi:hypothetical protein
VSVLLTLTWGICTPITENNWENKKLLWSLRSFSRRSLLAHSSASWFYFSCSIVTTSWDENICWLCCCVSPEAESVEVIRVGLTRVLEFGRKTWSSLQSKPNFLPWLGPPVVISHKSSSDLPAYSRSCYNFLTLSYNISLEIFMHHCKAKN